MIKRCEIVGAGPDSGFLAGLLSEAGWSVTWTRPPQRHPRLRPYRFRRYENAFLKRLLLRYGCYKAQSGNALNLQDYYNPEVLDAAFTELADRVGVELRDVEEIAPISANVDRILVVNEDPEFLPHWGERAFSTFRNPEKFWASELWFPDGRVSNHFSTQTLELGGTLLFLDPHPVRGYVLSIYSRSLSDNDRSLHALLSYKSRLPLFWRSLSLMNNRSRRVDKPLVVGGQEVMVPGLFVVGRSLGKLYEFSNTDMSDYFFEAWELFVRLRRAEDNATSLYQASEVWRREGRALCEKSLKRGRLWNSLLSSPTASQLCVPVVRKLPEPLRQLLQSPV